MRAKKRLSGSLAIAALASSLTLFLPGNGAAATDVPVNSDASFINVWDDNVENLMTPGTNPINGGTAEECHGDWKDLVYYMKYQSLAPDLFTVQQVNLDDIQTLVNKMNSVLFPGGSDHYSFLLANESPLTYNGAQCENKTVQTNGMIFRTGRFDPTFGFQNWYALSNQAAKASDPADCEVDSASGRRDRSQGTARLLYDKVALKYIVVGSMHWPVQPFGGVGNSDCAVKNLDATTQAVETLIPNLNAGVVSSLYVIGGDTNEGDLAVQPNSGYDFNAPDPSTPLMTWYKKANWQTAGVDNYQDPVYSKCAAATAVLNTCLDKTNCTLKCPGRRIDMIFAKTGAGDPAKTDGTATVTGAAANTAAQHVDTTDQVPDSSYYYSDHLAVRTNVHY